MSPRVVLANLKLKLVNAYLKDGRKGIEKILDKSGRVYYLKSHKLYSVTVDGAEEMCKQLIGGRR